MAKGIHDLGNGNGYIYVTDVAGSSIVKVFPNNITGVKKVKSLSSQITSASLNKVATGSIQITSLTTGGSITGILVNGNNQIGTTIVFTTSTPLSTLHSVIAEAINSYTPLTPYDITASFVGDKINLFAPESAGSAVNGYPVTVSYTGTIVHTTVGMAGGSDNTEVYDNSFGNRIFIDANYGLTEYTGGGTADPGLLTNAVEITTFVVPRAMSSAVDKAAATISSGKIAFTRKSSLTVVEVTNEASALTDNLENIDTTGFSDGDQVTLFQATGAGAVTTVVATGNITKSPYSSDIEISDIAGQGKSNVTFSMRDNAWEEISRASSAPELGDLLNVDLTGLGVNDSIKWDGSNFVVYTPSGGSGTTNLSTTNITATTLDIASSTGTDATIPSATSLLAGAMPAADKTKTDYITITQPVSLDALESDVSDLTALTGMPSNSTTLDTFTGTIIPDGSTIKSALQAVETFAEAITSTTNLSVANITATTLDVLSSNGTDATIPSATSVVAGLMPAVDKAKTDFITVTQAVDLDAMELDIADLTTLSGVASNATDLGTFTGTTISDFNTVKGAIQQLETAAEVRLSGSGTSGYLPKYTGSYTQAISNIYDSGTAIGIFGVTTPSSSISLGGNTERSIGLERHTTADTAGASFSFSGGGATSGATNKNGGKAIILGGIATGSGSSSIEFWTTTAGGAGTTDRAPSLKASITGSGHLNMAASGFVQFGGYTYLHYTNSASAAVQTNGCTFLGYNVGLSNAGNGNTGIGQEALKTITTGSNNTATGRFAGTELLNGIHNVFNGYYAGSGITFGSYNVVIGANATGGTSGASYNTAIGNNSMANAPNGSYNVGLGADSCYSVTSGAENTSIGYNSMNGGAGITGSYNVALGSGAGSYLRTSSAQNTFLGYNTAFLTGEGPFSYSTAIGAGATIRASNTAVIGGGSNAQKVTSIYLGSSPIYTQGDVTQSDILLTVGGTYYSSGNNMGGHNLVLGAGLATGTGVNGSTIGDIILKTTDVTGSGSTLGVLQTRMTIKGGSGYIIPVLPTSAAGLPTGALWNNLGIVTVA